MATPGSGTQSLPPPPSSSLNEGMELKDPMDFVSAILYIVFDAILVAGPIGVFYGYVYPAMMTWATPSVTNVFFQFAYYFLWIGNVVVYGIPMVFGGFTWLWNAYINAAYLAWNQYIVLWGGTILQGLNLIFMIAAAFSYQSVGDVGAVNLDDAFIEILFWAITTGGIYAGYWLLNNNFLTYYVVEEINHGLINESGLMF